MGPPSFFRFPYKKPLRISRDSNMGVVWVAGGPTISLEGSILGVQTSLLGESLRSINT